MLANLVYFSDLMLAALLVGAVFGVWLLFDPAGMEPAAYIAQQQQGIRALNVVLPAMGFATIVVTIGAALLARHDPTRLALLLGAVACLVAGGVITRLFNQPINARVITWSLQDPPADWTILRDQWWHWHLLRLGFGIGGLALLIAATLRNGASS